MGFSGPGFYLSRRLTRAALTSVLTKTSRQYWGLRSEILSPLKFSLQSGEFKWLLWSISRRKKKKPVLKFGVRNQKVSYGAGGSKTNPLDGYDGCFYWIIMSPHRADSQRGKCCLTLSVWTLFLSRYSANCEWDYSHQSGNVEEHHASISFYLSFFFFLLEGKLGPISGACNGCELLTL